MTKDNNGCLSHSERLQDAKSIMEIAHKDQTRWDGQPYSIHPIAVVKILDYLGINDEDMLCVGYLHDVLEDTTYSEAVLKRQFGERVLGLIKELTFKGDSHDDELYWKQCEELSLDAKWVKLADIIANLSDSGKKSFHFVFKRTIAIQILLKGIRQSTKLQGGKL